MTRDQTIRSIRELADLMKDFADDGDELVRLADRMESRLAELREETR